MTIIISVFEIIILIHKVEQNSDSHFNNILLLKYQVTVFHITKDLW